MARGRAGPAGPPGEGGGGGASAASDVTVTNEGYDNAQQIFDDLLYVPISITSFTGGGTFEIGQTVNAVNMTWSYNKDEVSQSLNQSIGALTVGQRSYDHTGQSITTNRTYTLTASDGTTSPQASISVVFRPKRYWGEWTDATPDNSEILTLDQELTTSRAKSITYDCTGGRFPIYAWPKNLGALSGVTVGGLAFSDYTVTEMSFTNAQGYTQDYYVFAFNTIQTGSAINVVFS